MYVIMSTKIKLFGNFGSST